MLLRLKLQSWRGDRGTSREDHLLPFRNYVAMRQLWYLLHAGLILYEHLSSLCSYYVASGGPAAHSWGPSCVRLRPLANYCYAVGVHFLEVGMLGFFPATKLVPTSIN